MTTDRRGTARVGGTVRGRCVIRLSCIGSIPAKSCFRAERPQYSQIPTVLAIPADGELLRMWTDVQSEVRSAARWAVKVSRSVRRGVGAGGRRVVWRRGEAIAVAVIVGRVAM